MPKSMTGFGRGECFSNDRRFKVELKSVNHRFSEFNIKLPRFLNPFEDRIRKTLANNIARGKVDVWIDFESYTQKDISININKSFADAYVGALKKLSSRYGFGELTANPAMELLAKNSEVIIFDKFESALSSEEVQQEMWETLSGALNMAMDKYNEMRETEGVAMIEDIRSNHSKAMDLLNDIKTRAPLITKDHAQRLSDRISEMLARLEQKPDDGRILTEISILADKSDINEEIARLESHLQQLFSMLSETEAVGRKMDFLMQELNREANTIGSKSSDVQMTKLAVDLKSVIEKIREQVQNIE